MLNNTAPDYSRYFWQGEKVRLPPLRMEDAEQSFINSLDSPSRQILQLGIELPTYLLFGMTREEFDGQGH